MNCTNAFLSIDIALINLRMVYLMSERCIFNYSAHIQQ